MENNQPINICILIPCYKNTAGVIQSINSIVYPAGLCRILVVDDGSPVPITRDALFEHVNTEHLIEVLRLNKNGGISNALNKGLEFIYNNYDIGFVARLDCGDICSPRRFIRQVDFMKSNPDIDLLGSWCYFRNSDTGIAYEYITPTRHELIERSMYFRNVFIHPSVMWRVSSMKAFRYPERYPHAEDYGLFYDIISKKKTAIIGEFLVTCEINRKGISFTNRFGQLKSRLRVIWDYGNNKLWVAAGICKLLVLMAVPYQLVYHIKKQVYKITTVAD